VSTFSGDALWRGSISCGKSAPSRVGATPPSPEKKNGRIKWPSRGRYLIEWRENGSRLREAAGTTPAEALEAQKRKRLELEARSSGLSVRDPEKEAEADALPLEATIHAFLQDIRTFRKPMTHRKYEHVLGLFAEHVAPKSDARLVSQRAGGDPEKASAHRELFLGISFPLQSWQPIEPEFSA
jgi:hypothetical protein